MTEKNRTTRTAGGPSRSTKSSAPAGDKGAIAGVQGVKECDGCHALMDRGREECPACGEPNAYARIEQAVEAGLIAVDPTFVLTPVKKAPAWVQEELRTMGGRIAAYRAMGAEMVEVDAALRFRARQLSSLLDLVASTDSAPQQMVEIANDVVRHWLGGDATGAEDWHFVLEGILACPIITADDVYRRLGMNVPGRGGSSPRARAVLASLQASVPRLPPQMQEPSEEALDRAERALRERLTDDGLVRPLRITRTKAGGRDGGVSPWGAAVRFAAAFGLTLPARKSKAKRTRKTSRVRDRQRNRAH